MTGQQSRILVVDDEAPFGHILKDGFEMHGFAVRYESRSSDTIKACLEFHPDLVFLDMDMPVKDGGQVASALHSHSTLWSTPVVLLSSLMIKQETEKQAASREILLSKQISIAELVDSIRAVLQSQTSH